MEKNTQKMDTLIRDICHNPNDDATRLEYAKCLRENGENKRAELIEIQCRLSDESIMLSSAAWKELSYRESVLLLDHGIEWYPFPLTMAALENANIKGVYKRGFVSFITGSLNTMIKYGDLLALSTPVEHIELTDLKPYFDPPAYGWLNTRGGTHCHPEQYCVPDEIWFEMCELSNASEYDELDNGTPALWSMTMGGAKKLLSKGCVNYWRKRNELPITFKRAIT